MVSANGVAGGNAWMGAVFALGWISMVLVFLSAMSGWRRMAKTHAAKNARDYPRTLGFQSCSMGSQKMPVNYGNCLRVDFGDDGFRMKLAWLFALGAPPLEFDWGDFERVSESRFLWAWRRTTWVVKSEGAEGAVIILYGKASAELYRRWKASQEL
jgi:hypothetical protein